MDLGFNIYEKETILEYSRRLETKNIIDIEKSDQQFSKNYFQ